MKINFIYLVFLFSVGCSFSKQATTENQNSKLETSSNPLEGTWVFKNILMGDAVDVPCGFGNEGKVKEMNVTFTSEKLEVGGKLRLHGQSSVNGFMGTYTILSYDEKSKTGKLKFGPIASTKMASENPDFMECENRYLSYLEKSENFKIEGGKLQLSKTSPLVKEDARNSPFGDSYNNVLYFEKK